MIVHSVFSSSPRCAFVASAATLFVLAAPAPLRAESAPPAGFVRVAVPAGTEVLASMPFDPFAPGLVGVVGTQLPGADATAAAGAVRFWDAASQAFTNAYLAAGTSDPAKDGHWFLDFTTWTPAPFEIRPGVGFWLRNPAGAADAPDVDVYLCGSVASNASATALLPNGLSLFAYPYAAARPLNATTLAADGAHGASTPAAADKVAAPDNPLQPWMLDAPGTPSDRQWVDLDALPADFTLGVGFGYWYWRAPTNTLAWTEPRPYAWPYAAAALPRIAAIAPDPASASATLTVTTVVSATAAPLDLYFQDLAPDGAFDPAAWRTAALGLSVPANSASITWTDNGTATEATPDTVHGRAYLVLDASTDTDGDTLPDNREVHLLGTDPTLSDTDGDGVNDAGELAAGFDPRDPDDLSGLPLDGLRLWLRAADLGPIDGASVVSWPDARSTSAVALAQTVPEQSPTLATATPAGGPAVRFDGADDSLAGSLGAFGSSATIFTVVRFDQFHQPANDYDYVLRIGKGTTPNEHLSISRCPARADAPADAYYSWNGANVLPGPVLPGGKWMLLSARHDPSTPNHRVFVNGVEQPAAAAPAALLLDGSIELCRVLISV